MNVVAARGQFLAEFRRHHAGTAIRWIACNADAHETASDLRMQPDSVVSYDTLFHGGEYPIRRKSREEVTREGSARFAFLARKGVVRDLYAQQIIERR